MAKNIEINYKNEGGYEVLYPNVQTASVLDIGNFYYNKTEVDEKIQDNKDYVDGLSFKKTLVCNQAHFDIRSGSRLALASNVSYIDVVGMEVILDNFTLTGSVDLYLYLEDTNNYDSCDILYAIHDPSSAMPYQAQIIIWFSQYGYGDDGYETYYRYGTSNGSSFTFLKYTGNTIQLRTNANKATGDITLYLLTY